jgi:uncharacterized protein (TIGR02246 family)
MQVGKLTALLVITLFGMTACAQHAPSNLDTSADETALRAADDTFERALHSGDVETVTALYAEDAVLLPAGTPPVRGREAIREFFKSAVAERKPGQSTTGTLSDRAVGVSADLGWSSGTSKVTTPDGTTIFTGKFLSVSRKVNGKWLYVRDTWNSDSP